MAVRLVPAAMLLMLLLAVTACTPGARPGPGPTAPAGPADVYNLPRPTLVYDPVDLEQARQVEYVGMRGATTGQVMLSRPLWGDRDAEAIAHILHLLRTAETPAQPLSDGPREKPDFPLVIHYRSGEEVWAAQAWQRLPSGAMQTTTPPRYIISGRGEVASDLLDQFLRGGGWRAFMPPVSPVTVQPPEASPGDTVTVRGQGWAGATGKAVITLVDAGGTATTLGEVPVERGEFQWQGALPQQIQLPPWLRVGIKVNVPGVGMGGSDLLIHLKR